MKGITIYLDLVKQTAKRLSDEELGRFFRATLEAAETETIPTFEDEKDDILFDGFRTCLEQGLKCVNGKRTGGKNSSDKRNKKSEDVTTQIKPNTNFDKGEVDENNLQLFLGLLNERKPQKNQTLSLLLNANSSISGFCDTNRINQATREKAWEIYTKGI